MDELYDALHGKEEQLPENASIKLRNLYTKNLSMRDVERKRILLKGLSTKIRKELWPRMSNQSNI